MIPKKVPKGYPSPNGTPPCPQQKQRIPMPKMPLSTVIGAISTTLRPFAEQYITYGAKETRDKYEKDAMDLIRFLNYPEPLINEAVNRNLSKF